MILRSNGLAVRALCFLPRSFVFIQAVRVGNDCTSYVEVIRGRRNMREFLVERARFAMSQNGQKAPR